MQVEEVVTGRFEGLLAFSAGGEADGLHDLDAERFDDRLEGGVA